jgi:hypothetical protein
MSDSSGPVADAALRAMPVAVAKAVPVQTNGTPSYYLNRVANMLRLGSFHRYIFVELQAAQLPALPRGYHVETMAVDDRRLVAVLPQADVRAWRFDQGCTCVGAFRGEQLVGLAWIARTRFVEDEVRAVFEVPDTCGWDLGMEVLAAFRGSRAVFAVLAALGSVMASQGLTRTISRIADSNGGSLSAHKKLGCTILGSAIFISLRRVQFCFSGLRKVPHVSVSAKAVAAFQFS